MILHFPFEIFVLIWTIRPVWNGPFVTVMWFPSSSIEIAVHAMLYQSDVTLIIAYLLGEVCPYPVLWTPWWVAKILENTNTSTEGVYFFTWGLKAYSLGTSQTTNDGCGCVICYQIACALCNCLLLLPGEPLRLEGRSWGTSHAGPHIRLLHLWPSLSSHLPLQVTLFICWHINTLRPRQNGRHFIDDIFKWIFLNANVWIPILRVQLAISQHWFR